jgi:nitrogen fixation NifU-like protein
MSDLRELYQAVIIDHHKKPRNFRTPDGANRSAEGYNPLCGDKVTVHLKLEDGVVKDIGFQGSGCAISTASASMMTESLKGKTLTEVDTLFKTFHELLTREPPPKPDEARLGKLTVFTGVREFPIRVKCATLAWHTLLAALKGEARTVSTE